MNRKNSQSVHKHSHTKMYCVGSIVLPETTRGLFSSLPNKTVTSHNTPSIYNVLRVRITKALFGFISYEDMHMHKHTHTQQTQKNGYHEPQNHVFGIHVNLILFPVRTSTLNKKEVSKKKMLWASLVIPQNGRG